MPRLYLSPSLQPFNKYLTTGDEQYWMNIIADDMVPILEKNGIRAHMSGTAVRVALHYFNNKADVDRLITFLKNYKG